MPSSTTTNLLVITTFLVICRLQVAHQVHTPSLSSSVMLSDEPINNYLQENRDYTNHFRLRNLSTFGEWQSDAAVRRSDTASNNRKKNKGGSKKSKGGNRAQPKGRGGRKGRRHEGQGDVGGAGGKGNKSSVRGQRQKANKNAVRLLARVADNIEGGGAFPPLSNVAPRARVTVNSTCGLNGHEEYCKLVDSLPHKTWQTQCGICDDLSTDLNKRHPIEAILNNSNAWWQSSTLQYGHENEYVTITLDLRQPHQIFFIMLKAAISPRPASWILEKSLDNTTYEPWQYFGLSDIDCRRRYGIPGQNGKYVFQSNTEVICTTQFSKAMPLENGEIHVSLLKNRPGAVDQTQDLLDFITARFIRIRFQGLHSTANADNSVGWVLDAEALKKRSFYSLKLIRVSGRLDCHGHATKTMEVEDEDGAVMEHCVCLHNSCGMYCDQCCPLYNDRAFHEGTLKLDNMCKKCECNEHAKSCTYENTSATTGGECHNCTHFTTGRNCEKCLPGYYRNPVATIDAEDACIKCECGSKGSTGDCDPESGSCICRTGFTGPNCEACLPGHKGENCLGCTCDKAGTIRGGECDDPCQCKLYADDETCSSCVPGYFALRPDHPDGCMKCFCSNVAVTCRSYEMEVTSFETLDSWEVTDITRTLTSHPSRDNDTGNLVFGMGELPEVEAVYWLAPSSYAGNLLQSYGSTLVVQMSWIVIRGDTSGKPTSGPNVILIGKNGAKIAYADMEFQETSATIEIPLIEKDWYHVPKSVKDIVTRLRRTEYRGDPVTRVQFMSVLSDVETVMIRGTFHTDQVESVLERATLYAGASETEENEWSLVEECQCPPGYAGLSCESCDFGYIRTYENSTSHEVVGKCIPCGCNGHAASCDLESGDCGTCVHNTSGERCERCRLGYYGNARRGTPLDCKRCACPLLEDTNNFSPSCQLKGRNLDTNQFEFDTDEDYVCTQCPDGYVGDHCEQCDDGYYGDPMVIGSKCLPCPCNGEPCHPITGECITCLGNTEGWRCERCKLGFWGDPNAACEPCNCHSTGSSSNVCDPGSGQCACHEHYSGRKCSECDRGYTKSLNKSICIPCECHVNGSVDMWCDPAGGQCVCKFGVAGLKCDACQEEYFGLTGAGCEECRCSLTGSVSKNCNLQTGQCECLPNVTGHRCTVCEVGFWNLTANVGCQRCECDPLGALDNICDSVTGRCVCKPGVGGYRCDRCLEDFYGLTQNGCKPCKKCPSDGYICDPVTGGCICPPNTKGPNCQQCQPNTMNWQPKIGCQSCGCDGHGSIGQSCDPVDGQCVCREGYQGRKCDSCVVGYYDYPNCKRCNCNIHGSQARGDGLVECDYRGQCPCKSLVTGHKCDKCRQNTFGLHKSNAEGCTRCFCFQRSEQCTQSDLSWGLVRMQGARNLSVEYVRPQHVPDDEYEYVVLVQMEGSTAYEEDAEIQTMNRLSLIPSSTGNVSIGAFVLFYYPLYFQLPPQFYGDQIKSYGGSLRFSILTGGARQPMDSEMLKLYPLVQIHSYDQLVLEYYQEEPRNASLNETFVVPLHESFWRFYSTSDQSVSRGAMMAALQHIRHIFLRGTTWMDFTEVVLHSVRMDSAIYLAGSTANLAHGVEQCLCPEKYGGLSCQDPGRGFYRMRNSSSTYLEDLVGRAVPCNCNGRSEDCDKETGACLNCRLKSGGDHCEKCAEGYYGNPSISECKPCPCPETSRNYAKGCSVWKDEVRCQCQPGYAGALCDMCAKGYFGLPSEPGGRCERCDCNPDGIVSDECDEENGQCNCRPGVTGRKCDRCITERYFLEDRRCKLCDNCTLTLMDTVEVIGNQLRRALLNINLSQIHAPYSKVSEYEKAYEGLDKRFDDFMNAKEALDENDGNDIDKLVHKSEDLRIQSRKQSDHAEQSKLLAEDILSRAIKEMQESNDMSEDAQDIIDALKSYDTNQSHVSPEIALKEAMGILNTLNSHRKNRENYDKIWQPAQQQFKYFARTSDRVQDQLVDLEKLLRDRNAINHRIADIDVKSQRALETISDADDIREHIVNYNNLIVEDYGLIRDTQDDLQRMLNNSFVADADTKAGMIDNGLTNLESNLDNILSLKDLIDKELNATDDKLRDLKKHWIPKARKHAAQLGNRADEYAKQFQTTKDGAKVALLASSAHQDISNAIQAAREAAKEAQNSAKLAQEKLRTPDGSSMTQRGEESLKDSKQLREEAIEKMQRITDLRKDLNINENIVDQIKSTIQEAGRKNNGISSSLEVLHNTATMEAFRKAIERAGKVSKAARDESKRTAAVEKDIDELRKKYASLEPDWEPKLGMAEENVTQIQSNLLKAKNSLFKVEIEASRANADFQKINSSLSKQLQDLKDKISKAKHAADGVRVSLDAAGSQCIRSYAAPNYGISTSNSIKITLALSKDVNSSPIIFIPGNGTEFIALEMVQKKIKLVWNLGGRAASVTHPSQLVVLDPKIDEAWYQIDVNRTLNIGSLLVRRMSNSSTLREEAPAVTAASNHEDTRFLVSSYDHVWIGGVPDSLRPKELDANPGLKVILHQVVIDGKPLGLWNFAGNDSEACGGAISGPIEASTESNARYFNGAGYAELKKSRRPFRKYRFSIQMAFKTFDENALLFLAVDNKNNRSISITLSNGRIVFRIDYGKDSRLEIVTTKKYNTGEEIRLEAAREFVQRGMTENGSLKVNGADPLNGSPTSPITSSMLPDLSQGSFYLGGVPPGFRSGITKAPGADNPFLGCMLDVQINGESYDPLEGAVYFGVEPSCMTAIKKAGFYGKGYIELPSKSLNRRANAGFVFRTLQPDCLLVLAGYPPSIIDNYDDLKGNYSVSLIDGKVQVWLQTGRDRLQAGSSKLVNDGEYHVLNLIKTGRKIELIIDDEKQWTKNLTGRITMPDDEGGLYFGGAPNFESYSALTPTLVPFEGCIQDVVFNNKTTLFSDALEFDSVEIGRDGPEMGTNVGSGDILMKTEPIGKSFTATPEGCQRVGSYSYEPNAFKFGDGPFSHSQLNITVRSFWQKNFLIKFDFRTFYPNGVVFVAPGTKEKQKHFVALLLKDGQLLLKVRGRKKVELLLAAKLNDGDWHQVTISCQERKVTMSVEIGDTGQRTSTQMKIPKKVSASNNIYVGGIPESGVFLPIEVESFKGCIRKMSINNSTKDLARPGKHFNVGQCFPKVEKGSYFHGDAYATYKKNFHVGKYLELEMDFRTSELNGVLLSVSEPNGFPALSLELHNGNIIFSCDVGDGNPFRVESHFPSKYSLCDNKWHNISALYDVEQIALRIDKHPTIISMAQDRKAHKVHTKSSLYIGGLPDIAPSGALLSRENYKGCIRNVSIRGERRDWIDMDDLHNVLLSECLSVD